LDIDESTQKLKSITILDRLLYSNGLKGNFEGVYNEELAGNYAIKSKDSLSGVLTIKVNCKVNEFEIYEKYKKYYPNLTIKYEVGKGNLTEAIKLKFYKNDENKELLYSVYSNGEKTIGDLISATGPNGEAMGTPIKPSDNINSYVWNDNGDEPDWSQYNPKSEQSS
jgi:hypothetical protein